MKDYKLGNDYAAQASLSQVESTKHVEVGNSERGFDKSETKAVEEEQAKETEKESNKPVPSKKERKRKV